MEAAALLALQVEELAVQQPPIACDDQAHQQCDVAYFKQVIWYDVFTHAGPQRLHLN
jgi:hypothetical protein